MPTLQKYQAQLHSRLYVHLRSQALVDVYVTRANQADSISCRTIHLHVLYIYFSPMKEPRYSIKNGFLLNTWLWLCFLSDRCTPGRQQFDRKTLGCYINKHSSRSHHALGGKAPVSGNEHVLLFLPYIALNLMMLGRGQQPSLLIEQP